MEGGMEFHGCATSWPSNYIYREWHSTYNLETQTLFPVPRTARSCGNPRRRTRPACKHGTLVLVSMVTYTSPPPQPLLARRTWHGAGDAGFHPSVRAQRRGGSRAAQTFVPVDPGRVILSFPELLFFSPLNRSSVDRKNVSKKRENGRRSNRRGGDSRPDSSKIATAK